MRGLARLTFVELKLFLREWLLLFFAVALPTILLLVFGSIPGARNPDPLYGTQGFLVAWVPSLLVVSLAIVGLNTMPTSLGTYREKGILRRLSVTPVQPAKLLVAHVAVNMLMALISSALLIGVAVVVFGVPAPRHVIGFAAALLVGTSSIFALGTLVAAVAPSARAATGVAMLLFFPTLFVGGVYLPREMLPDIVARIGTFTPPGAQALKDAWTGPGPDPLQLAAMVGITIVAGLLASRFFRWE